MEIKHEHMEAVLLAWAGKKDQRRVADAIAEQYSQLGGGDLKIKPGKTWLNQQNIFHRWLKGENPDQREKIRQLTPAILRAMPRSVRHRLSIYDTLERRAMQAAQDALGAAIDAHDDAIESLYSKVQARSGSGPTGTQQYH
ncbi:hypothetical protein D8682_26265 [Buttiauxella sp. 3AFRM03]|uniref:toxin YdaT family protein n=1 Tax=Buttiauxella sp. 3AFRM03 TaxID=2479367 RepID=UPI000EF83B89|nr:toxin YdaT family protein [Buttiauxella sp. 3AFRM03]AYN30177.1 hypothetical protein D8682_26265 [Buttiauxella sp. 3AFRM03]